MRLVILGGSGAGKGTQAECLASHFQVPLLSTGEILRSALALKTVSKTEIDPEIDPLVMGLAAQARGYVEQGELVPDEVMIGFIRQRLLQQDMAQGWILEGYPRTAFQAEELDFLLEELGQGLNAAIWLEVSEAVLIRRSLARSRSDDTLETVQRRIQTLETATKPLQDYYGYQQRLLLVNGDQAPETVTAEILRNLAVLAG